MMYEALGYPEDHPDRAIARASIDKLVVPGDEESYCQPCVSPVWDTALVCHTLLEAGDARSVASVQRGLQWLLPQAGARGQRRLGDPAARCASGRLGVPVQQRPLSRPRRHRRGGDGDGPAAPAPADQEIRHRHRPRARMDRGHAVRKRRLRRLRCRQHPLPSQQHPVRRSRRAARSADRGRHRALPVDARPARRAAGREPRRRPRDRLSARDPARRRQLVRPLGHELHLRRLVGAVRAQCGRARRAGRHGPPRRRLADRDPESRRRLGRGRHELQARIPRLRAGARARPRRPPGRCSP